MRKLGDSPEVRSVFPSGEIPRLSVEKAWGWRDYLERLRDEKGGLIRELTAEENRIVIGERLLTRCDFRYWGERYCQISLEARALAPLYPLWESQEVILRRIGEMELDSWEGRRKDGLHANILKARQLGASTLSQALLCHRTTSYAHTISLLASDVPDSSDHLFDMQERMIDHLPWYLKPTITERVKNNEIVYATGSRVLWGAGKSTRGQSKVKHGQVGGAKGQLGRGKTVALCHLSELSSWDEPDQIDDALLPAMPKGPYTLSLFESTAKGRHNWWHKHWLAAKAGSATPNFRNIFIPWYAEPGRYSMPCPPGWVPAAETLAHARRAQVMGPRWLGHKVELTKEQLVWYQASREYFTAKGKLKKFLEEYAADDEECFQHGGQSIFSVEVLDRLQQQVDLVPPRAFLEIDAMTRVAALNKLREAGASDV